MLSQRCKLAVKTELEKLGLHSYQIELGEAEISNDITDEQRRQLKTSLSKLGFELLDDKTSGTVDEVKKAIIQMIYFEDDFPANKTGYISNKLKKDYPTLSRLFSETTGTTIEYYIIAHKIERVKELLLNDNLSLTQISYKLDYSSVAHLSAQFRQVTGLTISYFMQLQQRKKDYFTEK